MPPTFLVQCRLADPRHCFSRPKERTSLPEVGGGGWEVIWAMPQRKHFVLESQAFSQPIQHSIDRRQLVWREGIKQLEYVLMEMLSFSIHPELIN